MSVRTESFALRFFGPWKHRAACSLAVGLLACWLLFGVMLGINIREVFEYFIPMCAVPALLVVALFYEIFTNALELARSLPEQARKDGLENKAAFWGVVVYTVLWFLPPPLLPFVGEIFARRGMSLYHFSSGHIFMLSIFAMVSVIVGLPFIGIYFAESLYKKKFGVSLGYDIKIKRDGKKSNSLELTYDIFDNISKPEPLPEGAPFVLAAVHNGGGRLLITILMGVLFACAISYFGTTFTKERIYPAVIVITVSAYPAVKYSLLPAMRRNAGRAYYVMLFFMTCCAYACLPLIFLDRMMNLSFSVSGGMGGLAVMWSYLIYMYVFFKWANRSFKILFGDPLGLRCIYPGVDTLA